MKENDMDDMQRYRDIKATADPDDPAKQLLASLAVSYDQAIAEAIRLERSGKQGALDRTLRKMDLTETADLLAQPDAALNAAYWKLREHASAYRSSSGVRKAYERWENTGRKDPELGRTVTVHEWFARGIEAAARDIAELLGVPEHEIEPEPETATVPR